MRKKIMGGGAPGEQDLLFSAEDPYKIGLEVECGLVEDTTENLQPSVSVLRSQPPEASSSEQVHWEAIPISLAVLQRLLRYTQQLNQRALD